MEKRTTTKSSRKLSPAAARLIRRSHGFRAAIAKAGGFHRSYVTRVMSGARPPSMHFFEAMGVAFERMARGAELVIVRNELDAAGISCGPREMGVR